MKFVWWKLMLLSRSASNFLNQIYNILANLHPQRSLESSMERHHVTLIMKVVQFMQKISIFAACRDAAVLIQIVI